MKLTWNKGGAFNESGCLVFSIQKQRGNWYLFRYSVRMDGAIVFQSKEQVRTKRDGIACAETLAAMCKTVEMA